MSSLKFGTSGLRGLVTDLTDAVCQAYVAAFINHMREKHGLGGHAALLIGVDLRASSPRIARACAATATGLGMQVEFCGALPTPALALHSLRTGRAAIMVTGSHIPDDRNGLKFYRPDGEIDKDDEAGILRCFTVATPALPHPAFEAVLTPSTQAIEAYRKRCLGILGPLALQGMRVGVYQHSSVARDLVPDLLSAFGADLVALARSDVFIPVDTEALRPEDIALAKSACAEYGLDALVSTDGDADRPLVADETGTYFRGDALGMLTGLLLGADVAVTPVTSSTAVETCGVFSTVVRTKVGSPHVIDGIAKARAAGAVCALGFEANGGVLLGSDVAINGSCLAALPTRDALLPILATLGLAAMRKTPLSGLRSLLPSRATASGRLEHVDQADTLAFIAGLGIEGSAGRYFSAIGVIAASDAIDGARYVFSNGDAIHYRASGNAPELRCYAEADSQDRADFLLAWGLRKAERVVRGRS